MSTLAHLTAVFVIANGKRATINLDFEANGDLSAFELENIAQAGYDGWSGTPNLRGQFTTAVGLLRCEAYAYDIIVNPSPPAPFKRDITLGPFSSAGALVAGSVSADTFPPQCAIVSTFYTSLAARRGRGRCFLPQVAEDNVDSAGILLPAYQATLQTAFDDWVVGIQNSAIAPQTFTHAVVSLTYDEVNTVNTRAIRNRVDTQRRRLMRELG